MSCKTTIVKGCPPAPCGLVMKGPPGPQGATGPSGSPNGALNGLSDVDITGGLGSGSVLVYNSPNSKWVAQTTNIHIGAGATAAYKGVSVGAAAVAGQESVAVGSSSIANGKGSVVVGGTSSDGGYDGTVVIGSGLTASSAGVWLSSVTTVPAGATTTAAFAAAAGTYNLVIREASGKLATVPVTLA